MQRDHRLCWHRGVLAVTYVDEHGRRQRRSTGTADRLEAERFLVEFVKLQAAARPEPHHSVDEIWEAYRLSLNGRPVTKSMLSEWKALKPLFGGLRAADLLAVDPETRKTMAETLSADHIEARRKAGRKDGAILTELSRLRTACAWASKHGMLMGTTAWTMPPKPRPLTRHLTRLQFETFLAACTFHHLRLFVILAIATAGRMSAILGLTWDRIDFERGLIHLDDPERDRTAKGRATVPMTASARAALQEARQGALTPYVIEWAGQRVGSVKKGIETAATKAGFKVSANMLRHSAAVWMAEAGASMPEIARYLGHADSRITERVYAKFSPVYLRKNAEALEVGPFARKAG
jgi:integrase